MLHVAHPSASSLRVNITPDAGTYSVRECDGIKKWRDGGEGVACALRGPAKSEIRPDDEVGDPGHVVHGAAR
jgi:hypothetical protein